MIRKNVAYVFLLHFVFVILIQLENAFFFYDAPLLQLIGGQFQNILISGVLATIYYAFRRNRVLLKCFFFTYIIFLILISLNQVFFQIFHENFAFSYAGGIKLGDIYNYWGSFTGELKPFHLINLAWIILSIAFILKREWVLDNKISFKVNHLASFSLLIVVSFFIQFGGAHSEVNSHLAFTAFRGVSLNNQETMVFKKIPQDQIYKLKYGSPRKLSHLDLDSINTILRKKKNIIFLVLESVGSMQIFEDGKINPEVFPFLSKNKKQTLSFQMVHNNFPGTTRSHIPIISGGETLTWGSVFKELLYPYTGPTIASLLKESGMSTALVSAMGLDFENLASFYQNLGFDYIYDSDKEERSVRKANSVHTWGIDEKITLQKVSKWLEKRQDQPFYLQFLTNTTHHPYGAPKNFNHGVFGSSRFENYKKSLIYTDHIIKNLVDILRKKGLLEETIIFISGDHGEAFGRFHKNVFAHKSSLYEETIKNFFLIYTPETELPINVLEHRSSLADILPTIIATKGLPKPTKLIGSNLLDTNYKERLAYFHKNTSPEEWGLRDGQWKYTVEKVGGKNGKLFNLDEDPTEQKNLLSDFPERSKVYQELIANWFIQTNDSFVKNLKDYVYLGKSGLTLEQINTFGPKRITVGSMPSGLKFSPLGAIHPEEKLTVWTHGVAYPKKKKLEYLFTSPSGKKHKLTFTHKPSWTSVYVHDKPKKPREPGDWKVSVLDGAKELVSTSFIVSKKAPLFWSTVNKKPGIRKIYFGMKRKKQDFQVLDRINPKENMAVYALVKAFKKSQRLEYVWVSPSGKSKITKFKMKKGWSSAWVYFKATEPMEPGVWNLIIKRKGKKLISGSFIIDPKAPVHEPLDI